MNSKKCSSNIDTQITDFEDQSSCEQIAEEFLEEEVYLKTFQYPKITQIDVDPDDSDLLKSLKSSN